MCFRVPPERMGEFGAAHDEHVAPFLRGHGLVESSGPGRATVDSVFSRLYAYDTPAAFISSRDEVWQNPAWMDLREMLGASFRSPPEGPIRCQLVLYRCRPGRGSACPLDPAPVRTSG